MAVHPEQNETCFVCDSDVTDKAVCLSIERTYFTRTSFPRKLSQLIGDDFMVVVSEDDMLCVTCASLINRLDKLEADLNEIKDVITGFLYVKYNLNIEEDSVCSSNGTKCSNTENDTKDTYSMRIRLAELSQESQQVASVDEKNSASLTKVLHRSSFDKIALSSDLQIKSEPHQCKCSNQCFGNCSDDSNKPSIPPNKLLEQDIVHNRNPLDPMTCFSEDSEKPKLSEDSVLIDVKKEKLSDCSNLKVRRTNDEPKDDSVTFGQLKFDKEVPVTILTALEVKNTPSLDEKPSNIQLSFCSGKEIPPKLQHLNFNLKRVSKPLKKTKCKRNNINDPRHFIPRKLRPILPKLNLSDILAPLPIIKTSCQDNTKNSATYQKAQKWEEDIETKKVLSKKEAHCKVCNMEFESLEKLKDHNKQHLQNKKIYKCHFCQKIFKTKSGVHNHEAVHIGKFSFCCDICGLCFTTRGTFEEHRSSHTKEERFICDVCGKKFNFQSTYWIHRKWHDNPYPYKCSDCGRLFKHSSMLSVHRRKHTGERPYKCSYCPLTFNVSNTLKRHLILHTKKYPYTCDACQQGFTTRFKYTEHMARTHNVFIDRPTVEKKDYKVAVYDNETENDDVLQMMNPNRVEDNEEVDKDAENSVSSFPDELSQTIEEIVLGPSLVLSEHSLSLTDSWLT